MRDSAETVNDVRDFWGTEACGTHFVEEFRDGPEFYKAYREYRYRAIWYIPNLVPFDEAKDKSVLEIGCGNGADGVMFAQNGARYTGVDLTMTAVEATRKHFQALGLPGTFQQENAERLSFNNDTFDVVYSMGVLHHTPNPDKTFAEVHRVLKDGGKAIIMLYHKHSFNYYIRIMILMRFKLLLVILGRLHRWKADSANLAEQSSQNLRSNEDRRVWDVHYRIFLKRGWSYLRAKNFVHHCADGPECPYAFVYTRNSVTEKFSKFSHVETKVAHFPLRQYLGSWFPTAVERWLAPVMGWNLIVYATK